MKSWITKVKILNLYIAFILFLPKVLLALFEVDFATPKGRVSRKNKPIWGKPLWNRQQSIVSIADTFSRFPPPLSDFFNNFFSLKLRAWNFLTLSFYPLDTMWRNFIKKYWLVDKLWHFCHQWLEIFCDEKFFFLQTHVNVFYEPFFHSFSFITLF